MKMLKTSLILAVASTATLAQAHIHSEHHTMESNNGIVSFQAMAEKEVKHDLYYATIFTRNQHTNLEQANNLTNQTLQNALKILKGEKNVQVKDSNISTQVHFNDKNQQDGWVVNGVITLQSQDNHALSEALTKLKSTMAVRDLSSGISQDKLASLDKKLVKKALEQMEDKAQFIAQSLHAKGYKIVSLNINGLENQNEPYLSAANYRSMNSATPVFGDQKTDVKARIDAQIQLIVE